MASDNDKRIFLCSVCNEKCENETSAVAHMQDVHNLKLIIPKKTRSERKVNNAIYQCHLCKKVLKRRSNLYRHIREKHKLKISIRSESKHLKCPESSCSSLSFMRRIELREHIEQQHGVTSELCLKNFPSFNDFLVWKENVENGTKSRYVLCNTKSVKEGKKTNYYFCHRSGVYVSKATGKKKPRNVKSAKINGTCPAAMEAMITDKGVEVKYWKTHFGHSCELDCLLLSQQDRNEIANKLKRGLSFQQILDEIRDSLLDGDVQRIHLLTVTDLRNISRAFKIDNKETLLKEPPDLNSWIDSMRVLGDNCPVICYKDKEVEEMNLRKPELFLVVMTKLQQKMLQGFESNIVCVDCINHTFVFRYYLITLITVDIYNTACPLAFCVTNRINERTISMFYNAVKATVGSISANHFMSVDRPVFYSEWQNVMGPTEHQLLCNWDIDKSWRQRLEKVSVSEETKVKLYKRLRMIMQEEKYDKFHSMVEDSLQQLEEDENTKEFASYFKSKHLERCELWAYCYRSSYVLNSCLILEKIHKELSNCYMEGENVSSLVRVLNLVIGVSRDKILEKSTKLPKQLQSELFANCEQILENQDIDVIETEHNIKRVCPPDCKPICSVCCICFHKFTCTCVDNFVSLNICKHIHASINSLKNQCTHPKGQDKSILSGDLSVFQNVSKEVVIETSYDAAFDTSANNSPTTVEIVDSYSENQSTDIEAENFRALLLQKVECFHHMVNASTCKPENYAQINEYFDKIFELFIEE